jgi:peptidoglycan/LPS O-acetylase OafA/YrhL
MEQLTLTTPAVLFSAISLILLAYTNRFLAYAALVRNLYDKFITTQDSLLLNQIKNMKQRLRLTQAMQILGIGSLLLCVLCMFLVYVHWQTSAKVAFGVALVLLIFSLALSIREIQISVKAIDLQLGNMKARKL